MTRPQLIRRLVFAAALFVSLSSASRAQAGQAAPAQIRRFALVIGSNDGGEGRVELRHAVDDARHVADVLTELGGVSQPGMSVVTGPTSAGLDAAIATLDKRLSAADDTSDRVELLVYYSGPSNRHGLLLGRETYTYTKLRQKLGALPADVRLVILDSCASGGMTRLKGGTQQPPFLVDDTSDVRGYAVLTSSSANEAAQESDELGASFFTHYLVSGLRGAADVNTDRVVTLNEAYQFAFHETLQRTEKTRAGAQHAAYDMDLSGRGDLVLTDMRQTAASMVLAAELSGRFFVRETSAKLAAAWSLWRLRTQGFNEALGSRLRADFEVPRPSRR